MPHAPWFSAQACSVAWQVVQSSSADRADRELDWHNMERHQEEDTHTDNWAQLARCYNAGSRWDVQVGTGGDVFAHRQDTADVGTACLEKKLQFDDHRVVAVAAGTIPIYGNHLHTAGMAGHQVQQDVLSGGRGSENLTWAVMGSCSVQTGLG